MSNVISCDLPIRCFPQTFSLEHLGVIWNSMFHSAKISKNLTAYLHTEHNLASFLLPYRGDTTISSDTLTCLFSLSNIKPSTHLLPVMSVSTSVDTSFCWSPSPPISYTRPRPLDATSWLNSERGKRGTDEELGRTMSKEWWLFVFIMFHWCIWLVVTGCLFLPSGSERTEMNAIWISFKWDCRQEKEIICRLHTKVRNKAKCCF